MISRPIAFASAMSLPTSRPSHTSAHSAELVRRGSTAYSRAPLWTPRRRWWKKIGCVSRALLPQSTIRSVSSASRYELVPPPAPNTVARPATEGACQVRLQLSMLLLPRTCRESFCAAKLTSLVALEQLKIPIGARASALALAASRCAQSRDGPVERLVPGGLAELAALRVAHEGMGQANVRLRHRCLRLGFTAGRAADPPSLLAASFQAASQAALSSQPSSDFFTGGTGGIESWPTRPRLATALRMLAVRACSARGRLREPSSAAATAARPYLACLV